jgi:hypothetical protein
MTTATATLSQLLTEAGSQWAPLARGEDTWEDSRNDAMADLLERYETCPEALLNFETSDWVNLDEPYTSDLIKRYERNTPDIKALFESWCDAIGATSTLEALEGQTIEDPEDMMAAMVNVAMTYAAQELIRELWPDR